MTEQVARSEQQANNFPRDGFAREPEVLSFSGLAHSTVWTMAKKGLFPKPQQLPGMRVAVWKREELWRWYENPQAWAQQQSAIAA